MLGGITRHLLLMTATPHAGQGGGLPAVPGAAGPRPVRRPVPGWGAPTDTSGLMRRMVKEDLLTFEGKPLFPERIAETVPYELSDARAGAVRGGHPLRARPR